MNRKSMTQRERALLLPPEAREREIGKRSTKCSSGLHRFFTMIDDKKDQCNSNGAAVLAEALKLVNKVEPQSINGTEKAIESRLKL